MAAAVTIGIVLTWFWPYINPITLTIFPSQNSGNEGYPDFSIPIAAFLLLGPVRFGRYGLAGTMRLRRSTFAAGVVSLFTVFIAGMLLQVAVTQRLPPYAIIAVVLAYVVL